MTAIDLLRSKTMTLPRERLENDFEHFLRAMLDSYLDEVRSLSDSSGIAVRLRQNESLIQKLSASIISAVDQYFRGFTYKASEALHEGLRQVEPALLMLASIQNISTHLQNLYRIRVENSLADLERHDIFHIPFELRHKVSTRRYSIPGLPCLYLGGSVWVCWEELGRPPFDHMQLAQFRVADGESIQILDFGYTPDFVAHMATAATTRTTKTPTGISLEELVASYMTCWPLIAACSIRVRHPGAAFVPEYIVPQMLLQWITKEKTWDGLRYFSTRIKHRGGALRAGMNYVFPVKNKGTSGFCDTLRQKFEMTSPVAWPILLHSGLVPNPGRASWEMHITPEVSHQYSLTEFSRCEGKLDGMPFERI